MHGVKAITTWYALSGLVQFQTAIRMPVTRQEHLTGQLALGLRLQVQGLTLILNAGVCDGIGTSSKAFRNCQFPLLPGMGCSHAGRDCYCYRGGA